MDKRMAIVLAAVCFTVWAGSYVAANDITPEQMVQEAKHT